MWRLNPGGLNTNIDDIVNCFKFGFFNVWLQASVFVVRPTLAFMSQASNQQTKMVAGGSSPC